MAALQAFVSSVKAAALVSNTNGVGSAGQNDACRYACPAAAAPVGVVDTRLTTTISDVADRLGRHGATVPAAKPCTPSGTVDGELAKPSVPAAVAHSAGAE